ncbi:MAG: SpoIIE family protein phosphatase [Microscillaceae bacterium]|nr:SpoIIE family protein phosphatase [Microscillaceae bacterium]
MTPKENIVLQNPVEASPSPPNFPMLPSSAEEGSSEVKSPTRQFIERYWMALIVTGILFYMSYSLLTASLDKQGHYVSQISIIERQYLLNQEIVNQILLLRNCQEKKYCLRQLNTLKEKTDALKNTQETLLKGHQILKKENMKNPLLDQLVKENKVYYNKIMHVVRQFILFKQDELNLYKHTIPNPNLSNISAGNISKVEPIIFKNINAMVRLYNVEAQAYIQKIKLYQGIVLLVALMVLSLEAMFLFPNIVRKIKLYTKNLEVAHLETQEKNREISQAYNHLKVVEEVTRLNAEALKKTNLNLLQTQEKLTLAHEELKTKNLELQNTHDIMNINRQLEAARFFDASMNYFSDVMRWKTNQNIYSWSENLLSELIPYVQGLQAMMYVYEEEKDLLLMTGSFALDPERLVDHVEVNLGDGWVGQVAKSLKPIYIANLNGQAEMLSAQVGTQIVIPQSLFVLPCTYNHQIAGVLEIISAKPLEEKYLDLLNRMGENIGSHLSTLQDQKRIIQLFAESKLSQKRLRQSLTQIQENEERFRMLSELTQEGMLFLNENTIRDVNSVLINMFDYESNKELIGKHYINLIAPKYRFEIEVKKMLQEGQEFETVAVRKNNETFPIEIQARQVTYNKEEITVISIKDITEKKKTQDELAEANRIARLVTELEKKNRDITSSIAYAQRIQEAILPSDKLIGKGFLEHFVLYIPKDIVSGDFYWFAEKNEHALIAAVDCTGHGVPGAFMSIIGYSNLNKIVMEQGLTNPADILATLDKEVSDSLNQQDGGSQSRDGMDVALCSLNIYEKKLSFAGAYRPLYLFRDQEVMEYKGNSFPIGGNFKYKKQKNFNCHEITLLKGDTLYIFSDGFPDQFGGPENRKYMSKNFKSLLKRIQQENLNTQKEIIYQEFLSWKGDYKQMDDILVIGLRF